MSEWLQHLVIVPVVLPLVAGALLVLVNDRRHATKAVVSLTAAVLELAAAVALLLRIDGPQTFTYRVGDWPAPFGIVLVADALSTALVLLTTVITLATLVFSLARWHRIGRHFHSLVHFMLMGVCGAFLTGDLFNLFVFFELLLAASFGLALLGSGSTRVVASLHYITINITASLLFLLGAALIYGVTGTLNMADLAAQAAAVGEADRALFETGAAILAIAFLVKAAVWPLGLWLPPTYGAAIAPAAALFVILTKVGVYAVLRTWLLLFGEHAGPSAGFGGDWLLIGGIATLVFGMIGMLAVQELPRMVGHTLLVSSGTLLAAIGSGGSAAVTAAALYYLVVSTLGVSAFFLLVELIERGRRPSADVLAVTLEAFGEPEDEEDELAPEPGVAIPATMALLGLSFAACALLVAGLPPLPAFIAKLALLSALLQPDPVPGAAWALLALLMVSALTAVLATVRVGMRIFWVPEQRTIPPVRVVELAPIAALLGLCLAATVAADPVMRYLGDAALLLHLPQHYVDGVLKAP